MALIWRKESDGTVYEVRSAGRTRRLYINGLLNTQYNPRTPFGGSLWDLLSLPALLCEPPPRRVLVLGVGGGTVIHQLDRLVRPRAIVGVELSPIAIGIARRYFGVALPHVRLVRADARDWLPRWQGEPFDLVIDDLYTEVSGEPVRAVVANAAWFRNILQCLSPNGMVVVNHAGTGELLGSPALRNRRVRSRFGAAVKLTGPLFENAVLALYRRPIDGPVSARAIRERFSRLGLPDAWRLQFGARRLY